METVQQQAGSDRIGRKLDDAQPRQRGQPPVVGEERRTSGGDGRGKLQCVGRGSAGRGSQLRRDAQMIAVEVDHPDTAAPREHSFIAFGQRDVASAVRNDKHLEQRER